MPSAETVLEQGIRITPFIRPWSTTERIESNPFDGGRSVMRSMDVWAKGLRDFGGSIGIKVGCVGFRLILNC